ncbi:MAG: hypothetical protein JST28_09055 [Acidobacteria bacterium]|nr:hypothetical protein [Acidobacteriota bacterium]
MFSLLSTTRIKVLALPVLVLSTAAIHAQVDPTSPAQIKWPLTTITGSDTPIQACTAANYGQPFQRTDVSPNKWGTCGADGWVYRGNGATGVPNGRVVTSSTTAACGEFIRDDASGTSTITLPSLAAGCTVAVQRGVSAGVVTINPGATSYDGVTTQLPQGSSLFVWTDGTAWHSNSPLLAGSGLTLSPGLTGSTLTASGGGGGSYTNLVASSTSDTTVAIINGKCTSGQAYLLSTAATLTAGGTINCPVVFSAGGMWSAGSALTVTLAYPAKEMDGPWVHFGSNVTIAFTASTQTHAPFEWWGAIADGSTNNYTAMQACIAAKPVQCDALLGQYNIGTALSFTNSNTGIHGAVMQYPGAGSMIVQTTAGADIIDAAGGGVNSPLYNLHFDHFTAKHSGTATGTAKGVSLSYTQSAVIDHVLVQDNIENFHLLNFQNGLMIDCDSQWAGTYTSGDIYGLRVDGTAAPQSAAFVRVNINGLSSHGAGAVVHGYYGSGTSLNDQWFQELQVSSTDLEFELDGSALSGQIAGFDITVLDSKFDGAYTNGVKVTNMPSSSNSAVTFIGGECSLQPTATSGVATCAEVQSSTAVSFLGMQFSQGSHSGNQGWLAAFHAKDSSHLGFIGNIVTPSTGFECAALENVNYSSVSSNTCNLSGLGASAGPIINVYGTSTGNGINSNNIKGGGSSTLALNFGASAANNIANDNVWENVSSSPVADANGTNSWNSPSNSVINGTIKNNALAGTGSRIVCAASDGTLSSSGCGGANGTVTYTSSQTASASDNGKLVIFNCSAACAYTLPATQPSATWSATVQTIGSTNATIALGGSDTYNSGSSVPVLLKFNPLSIWANSATSTDYRGGTPPVAGSNVTITPAANGQTFASSGGGGGGGPTTFADVTGSRAVNTVYQNTNTTPMYVSVHVSTGTVSSICMIGTIGSTSTPNLNTFQYDISGSSAARDISGTVVVPPNWYYTFTWGSNTGSCSWAASASLGNWIEGH